jgi:hypothetical protein
MKTYKDDFAYKINQEFYRFMRGEISISDIEAFVDSYVEKIMQFSYNQCLTNIEHIYTANDCCSDILGMAMKRITQRLIKED